MGRKILTAEEIETLRQHLDVGRISDDGLHILSICASHEELREQLIEANLEILAMATPTTSSHEYCSRWLYEQIGYACLCGYCHWEGRPRNGHALWP